MCRGFESLLRYQNYAVTSARPVEAGILRYSVAELDPPFLPIRKVVLAVERQPASTPRDDVGVGAISSALPDAGSRSAIQASWIASWASVPSPSGSFRLRSRACRHGASQAFEKLAP